MFICFLLFSVSISTLLLGLPVITPLQFLSGEPNLKQTFTLDGKIPLPPQQSTFLFYFYFPDFKARLS